MSSYTVTEQFIELQGAGSKGEPLILRESLGFTVLTPEGAKFATLSTQEEADVVAARLNQKDGRTATHLFLDLSKPGLQKFTPRA